MSEHSREPWRPCSNGDAIICDDPTCVKYPRSAEGRGDDSYDGAELVCESVSNADARRIIACVNVLAGVPTEVIEILLRHGRHLEVHARESGDKAAMVAWVSEAPL